MQCKKNDKLETDPEHGVLTLSVKGELKYLVLKTRKPGVVASIASKYKSFAGGEI